MKIKINEQLPEAEIFKLSNGEPIKIITSQLFKNKKAIIFGLPGAYTSVCSAKHLPGYVKNIEKFRSKGIELIACISVNDPFVMDAWGKANNVKDKIIMLADPYLSFTKSIGTEVDKSARGLGIRSNRYTLYIDNLKIKLIKEELNTGSCELSAAENFIKLI